MIENLHSWNKSYLQKQASLLMRLYIQSNLINLAGFRSQSGDRRARETAVENEEPFP